MSSPEAVTRALEAHQLDPFRGCRNPDCAGLRFPTNREFYAHQASVLVSLPDDRLAEAEAKVIRAYLHEPCGSLAAPEFREAGGGCWNCQTNPAGEWVPLYREARP